MSKRFTDTGKWDDPWFTDLKSEYKLFYIYILDRCDIAGVWKLNKKMAEFCIGCSIDTDDFLKIANDRIKVFGDKWLIKKFIEFQYGALTDKNKAYNSIMAAFRQFSQNKGDISPIDGGKEQVKETVKEQKGGMGGNQDLDRNLALGEDGLVRLTKAELDKLNEKLGSKQTSELIDRLAYYIGSHGKKYKSHYFAILSWSGREAKPQKKLDLWKCFVCSKEVPEKDRRLHMDTHEKERDSR